MAGILSVINTVEMATTIGSSVYGRQGPVATPASLAATVSVGGQAYSRTGSLDAAALATIYNAQTDLPATFDYLWFKSSQVTQIQLLSTASHVVLPVAANQPFVLGANPGESIATCAILGVANATDIIAQATLEVIDGITIMNVSSSTADYQLILVD